MRTGMSWTVGQKLLASFVLISAITAVLGGIGYFAVENSARTINELGVVRLSSVDSLLRIKSCAENIRGTLRTLGIPGLSAEMRRRQYDNLTTTGERVEEAWKDYDLLPHTAEEAASWKQFIPAWEAWRAEYVKALDLSKKYDDLQISDPAALQEKLQAVRGSIWKSIAVITKLVKAWEQPTESEIVRSVLDPKEKNPFSGIQAENVAIRTGIGDLQSVYEAIVSSAERIRAMYDEGLRDDANREYDEVFQTKAMMLVEGMRPLRAEADKGIELINQLQAQLLGPVTEKQRIALDLLDEIEQANKDVAGTTVKDSLERGALFKTVSLASALICVIASLSLGVILTRSITKPINRIVQSLTEGSLMVAEASNQVNASATSLAEGASEQASSLEETSSALEQMASMTRNNAENSKEANHLVQTTQDAAKRSEAAKSQLDSAMNGINESSAQISKIIKVIEEIAFQTNLLALNAAVEAARAGEHGKGFAVVAEEVRNLAQRAAEAARETTGLIETSVARAREGTEVANGFGQAIGVIVENVSKISNLISGITQASDEQARGVEQINVAVGEMDKVTQQIAANSEESASAVEELSAQASNVATQAKDLAKVVGTKIQHVDRHRAAETVHQNIERRRISKQDPHHSGVSYNKGTKPLTGKSGSVTNTTTHAPEHSGSLSEF